MAMLISASWCGVTSVCIIPVYEYAHLTMYLPLSATKITVGWTLAIPLTMLCLTKHLESIAANRQAVITERDKRRRIIFESIMCYGVPMIFMAIR